LKDMPTALPPGLQLAAFIERADPRDALISKGARSIAELPDGATVATGSIRRRAQVRARRPDIAFSEIRGNIETRLRKFHDSSWDAMILAGAGLSRLGLDEQITALIEPEEVLHAVGQGIMTVECREADYETAELVAGLTHPPAEWAALAERALMRRLEGGCQVPIGAHAETVDGTLTLEAAVVSLDGERVIRDQAGDAVQSRDQARERADALGRELADRLIAQGAEAILAEIRHPRSEP
jgi:hydroxymethylbilane synthase